MKSAGTARFYDDFRIMHWHALIREFEQQASILRQTTEHQDPAFQCNGQEACPLRVLRRGNVDKK